MRVTGIEIRAEVDGKWGDYDLGDPRLPDETIIRWLRETAKKHGGKFYQRLIMVLLARSGRKVDEL